MSANKLWTSRYENEEGYGDTFYSWGTLNMVDGRIYIESVALEQYLKDFIGHNVGIEIVDGLKRFENYGLDKRIAPLVKALQKLGVRTLMSCQGHLSLVDNKFLYLSPQVDFPAADVEKIPSSKIPMGWEIRHAPWGDPTVVRIRAIKDATSEQELSKLQDEAEAFAEALAQ